MSDTSVDTDGYITPSLIFLGIAIHQAGRLGHVMLANMHHWKTRYYLLCISALVLNFVAIILSAIILDQTLSPYEVPATWQGQILLWRMLFNLITSICLFLIIVYRFEEMFERNFFLGTVAVSTLALFARGINCVFGFIAFGPYAFGTLVGKVTDSPSYDHFQMWFAMANILEAIVIVFAVFVFMMRIVSEISSTSWKKVKELCGNHGAVDAAILTLVKLYLFVASCYLLQRGNRVDDYSGSLPGTKS